jgi:hypothetical protein
MWSRQTNSSLASTIVTISSQQYNPEYFHEGINDKAVFQMPYNTRRKSLSLPSLGIHVPITHATRAALASAGSKGNAESRNSASHRTNSTASDCPPHKKLKRSHGDVQYRNRPTPGISRSQAKSNDSAFSYEHTPPPSPKHNEPCESPDITPIPIMNKVDPEGIDDAIVEGVIVQLQDSGNRPHLVKDLVAVLSKRLSVVQQYVFC